jgi:5-methylcytosine-specific restriction endonuclease McrA
MGRNPNRQSFHHKNMSEREKRLLKRLRNEAERKQNYKCFWCQIRMNNIENHKFCCSADHLIELRDGGTTCEDNVVAACKRCNDTRSEYYIPDWDEILKISKETNLDISIISLQFDKIPRHEFRRAA